MPDGSLHKNKRHAILSLFCALLALGLWGAFLFTPANASEEYNYTVKSIFQCAFFPLLLLASFFFYLASRGTALEKIIKRNFGWFFFCLLGLILVCIPLLSPWAGRLHWHLGLALSICWALGPLCLAIGFFWLSSHLKNIFSGLLCLFASLFLAYFVGEAAYLITQQTRDGRWHDPTHSKYVLAGKAISHIPMVDTAIGPFPKRPDTPEGASAHREMRYDQELFDAKYTFNEKNRRIMPKADLNPKADLMIFGCSFTFGYGLNDEETWAWLLAKELGPGWKVDNYAVNGFGAQQMLAMLEENMVDMPTAPIRQALFLAIEGHIPRNSGLFPMDSPTYELKDNGALVRGKMTNESPYRIIVDGQHVLNGSQLARELSDKIVAALVRKFNDEHTVTFLAILKQASKILREKYGATLTVLLWPNIERLAPELEKMGIPVLMARSMLKDFDTKGVTVYHIVPYFEGHPNLKATTELAAGLAQYYRENAGLHPAPRRGPMAPEPPLTPRR